MTYAAVSTANLANKGTLSAATETPASIVVTNGTNTNMGEEVSFEEAAFSDVLFEGKEKTFELNFWSYVSDSAQNQPIYTYQLINMNKETFLYYQSAKKHMNSDPFLSEPIKVYSNIENGFGIFGTRFTSKITK